MSIRILLADDHAILRDGIRALLGEHQDMEVVAEARDGHEAVRLAEELLPDITIMDISMPGLNGIEATRQIVRDFPNAKVLILSMHSDKRFVSRALKAGAAGYLLKDCLGEELTRAIRTVVGEGSLAGRTYLSPGISDSLVQQLLHGERGEEASADVLLTPREREVLQLIAEGISTKAIAGRLGVSVKTIETHRQRMMKKLELFSVAELTKYAIREGLTTPEG